MRGTSSAVLALAAVLFAAAAVAPEARADDDCGGHDFNLSWIDGGPYQPPHGKYVDPRCAGSGDTRDECRKRHEGDGHHAYVPSHDQGPVGDCTYQALAGVLNYRKSLAGKAPDVIPEFLASQSCDSIIGKGGARHNFENACASYNQSGSCARSDLASVCQTHDLACTLESAANGIRNGVLKKEDHDALCKIGRDGHLGGAALDSFVNGLVPAIQSASDQAVGIEFGGEGAELMTTSINAALEKDPARKSALQKKAALLGEYVYCQFDKQLFSTACAGKIDPPADPQLKVTVHDSTGKDAIAAAMNLVEANKEPLPIRLGGNVKDLFGGAPLSAPLGDQGHAVLLVGRQKVNGACGYWVRNSWGPKCPVLHTHVDCDSSFKADPSRMCSKNVKCDPAAPGNVWVSADNMATSFTNYYEVSK